MWSLLGLIDFIIAFLVMLTKILKITPSPNSTYGFDIFQLLIHFFFNRKIVTWLVHDVVFLARHVQFVNAILTECQSIFLNAFSSHKTGNRP